MKKILSLFLAFTMVMSVLAVAPIGVRAVTSEFAGGSGTEKDPYLIENKYQLDNVRNNLSAYYKMVNDVEFSESDFLQDGDFYNNGQGWEPIGELKDRELTFPPNTAGFIGSFDGNGKKIVGLKLNISENTNVKYAGLFCCNNGEIKSLRLINALITVESTNHTYAGGIVGLNHSGSVINSSVANSTIEARSSYASATAGGLVGISKGESIIKCCYNSGNVLSIAGGNSFAGGINGSGGGEVSNCYNTGTVSSEAKHSAKLGGISGTAEGSVLQCYNIGSINGSSTQGESYISLGGISGHIYGYTIVNNCYYNDSISKGFGYGGELAVKCSSESMKNADTFVGFDFINIWELRTDCSYEYPTLKVFNVDNQEEIAPQVKLGDVNGDGDINIMDATEIQRHIAQLSTIPEDRLSCADANKDNQVNIMDATQIQRFIAQLIPSL